MPPEGPRSIVEELVTIARRALRAAELLAGEPELVHAVCFHGQQAVEKMLKAALLAAGANAGVRSGFVTFARRAECRV